MKNFKSWYSVLVVYVILLALGPLGSPPAYAQLPGEAADVSYQFFEELGESPYAENGDALGDSTSSTVSMELEVLDARRLLRENVATIAADYNHEEIHRLRIAVENAFDAIQGVTPRPEPYYGVDADSARAELNGRFEAITAELSTLQALDTMEAAVGVAAGAVNDARFQAWLLNPYGSNVEDPNLPSPQIPNGTPLPEPAPLEQNEIDQINGNYYFVE